jgi:dTDP-4-dehydrorhamnose 3,5-epimerase
MELRQTALPRCFELACPVFGDDRGRFTKVFRADLFEQWGLATFFAEEYSTLSRQGVLRGMHLQLPPHDHAKLVYCAMGSVLDVLLDLRVGSPTYGQHANFHLDAEAGNALYVAAGVAHGFYVPVGQALMVYKVTTMHSPAHDTGVRWDSAGIDWPNSAPIVSARDRALPTLEEFTSPFKFEPP